MKRNKHTEKSNDKVIDNNLLYIIGGREALSDFVKNIETNHIESVMVINGKKRLLNTRIKNTML